MKSKKQMPDSWQVVRLGDVAEINQSNWNPGQGSTILYLDLTSVIEPGILAPPKKLAAKEAPSRARRQVRPGDILVSTVRPNLRGFARVPEAPRNLVASTGFAVVSPRRIVNGSFVYQHVMTSQFAQYLENAATGQAYPAVLASDVAGFRLPVPPLPEQCAIAAVLDSIDEAIERTDAVIDATERLRDSKLHELLTRGVPGWHSEWKESPGIGTIPACWEVVRLGDVAEVRNGTTPSRAKSGYWQNGVIPFVRTGQVHDVTIEVPEELITNGAVTLGGAVVVPKGSVLIAMIGQGKTRGMSARLGIEAAINQNFAAVFGTERDFGLDFLFVWARQNYSDIRALGQGSNQDALNCELIAGMRVPKPTVAEQRAISAMADCFEDALEQECAERTSLHSLKSSASDALLTGRVLVRRT